MTNYTVVITGANTGIGRCTANSLVKMGARVILACRDADKGNAAVKQIELERIRSIDKYPLSRYGSVHFAPLDLNDLNSVKDFVPSQLMKCLGVKRIDVLINNAGINTGTLSKHGLNQLFQVNYLGHFLLFRECRTLLESRENNDYDHNDFLKNIPSYGRVVNLSSVMHHFGSDDYKASAMNKRTSGSYYDDSKYFMLLMTMEINKRYHRTHNNNQRPINAIACNPGAVRSDIWRHVPAPLLVIYDVIMRIFFLTVQQGAATSIYASNIHIDKWFDHVQRINKNRNEKQMDELERKMNEHNKLQRFQFHRQIPYVIPYYMPFNSLLFEMINYYVTPRWSSVTLTRNVSQTSRELWEYSEEVCNSIVYR